MNTKPVVVIVAGPTASGKSRLAMDLACAFGGTVINADSMQIYRELRVISARPSPEDEARVPHRLYGVLSAGERCSAGRWRAMAVAEIDDAVAVGRLPVIVGGTGLYLKALVAGLAPVPDIAPEVRADAVALHAAVGAEAFHHAVAALDPETAARLPAGDSQRLIRAFEVATATGRPLSAWQRETDPGREPAHTFITVALMPPRDELYRSIDARFDRMMAAGALDEVRALVAMDLDPSLPAAKAVGVRELAVHVRGECDHPTAIARAKRATRNYAKRQVTWIRHQLHAALPLNEQYSERLRPIIFTFIRQFLLTPEA